MQDGRRLQNHPFLRLQAFRLAQQSCKAVHLQNVLCAPLVTILIEEGIQQQRLFLIHPRILTFSRDAVECSTVLPRLQPCRPQRKPPETGMVPRGISLQIYFFNGQDTARFRIPAL